MTGMENSSKTIGNEKERRAEERSRGQGKAELSEDGVPPSSGTMARFFTLYSKILMIVPFVALIVVIIAVILFFVLAGKKKKQGDDLGDSRAASR